MAKESSPRRGTSKSNVTHNNIINANNVIINYNGGAATAPGTAAQGSRNSVPLDETSGQVTIKNNDLNVTNETMDSNQGLDQSIQMQTTIQQPDSSLNVETQSQSKAEKEQEEIMFFGRKVESSITESATPATTT